jgi:hypothetical protein
MAGRDGSPDPGGREERPGRRGFLFCVGFETGALLEAAKAELKHGEWSAMFQTGELLSTKGRPNGLSLFHAAITFEMRHMCRICLCIGALFMSSLNLLTSSSIMASKAAPSIRRCFIVPPGKSPIDGCLNTGATKYWPTHKTPVRDSAAGL